jgi:hypothetical protein
MESGMPMIVRGVVRDGRIEPLEPLNVADGTQVLVALPEEGESDDALWRLSTQVSLQRAWESPDDDVYDALSKG